MTPLRLPRGEPTHQWDLPIKLTKLRLEERQHLLPRLFNDLVFCRIQIIANQPTDFDQFF
ncbi:MAG: hypothetical protein V2J55_08390 [Candidatus Competibacteraceae bacterium]|jgi:hypothetical protein|nr:hypothetical protein [Candidatus Competibacteraceae bacterium]